MYLKLVGQGGDFCIMEVSSCSFRREAVGARAVFRHGHADPEQEIALAGSAYILNGDGKTIESYQHDARQADRKTSP